MLYYLAISSFLAAALIGAVAEGSTFHDSEQAVIEDRLTVDLDYAVYKGFTDASKNLNVWLGYGILSAIYTTPPFVKCHNLLTGLRIRYAEAPYGKLRWRAPQIPETNRNIQDASVYGPVCFQSYPAIAGAPPMPEGKTTHIRMFHRYLTVDNRL